MIDDIELQGCGFGVVSVLTDKAVDALSPLRASAALLWANGPDETGDAYEAWFQFIIESEPFAAPVDGSCDFSVWVTVEVEYKVLWPILDYVLLAWG